MGKFLKPGRVVVVTSGRYAGKKAVIVKCYEEGTNQRKFPHAIVAGLDRAPQKITRKMSARKIKKRSHVKPFYRFMNLNHILPTRYVTDIEVKKVDIESGASIELNEETLGNEDATLRASVKAALKKEFENGYQTQNERKSAKNNEGTKFLMTRLALLSAGGRPRPEGRARADDGRANEKLTRILVFRRARNQRVRDRARALGNEGAADRGVTHRGPRDGR
eukprot:CAMPEP_0181320560 /NCGR_PEP_ID=MMETSP1101-20121128/18193_1 /TAXON_ID=46948 /ORGANISM="Rhodomonas abbreviata, Strain Caron Lab Isolate" /LENGTH=220 /DNA_ID=CAMNT_0023428281 /DNA_START=33 /DNA_END=691 /DNA_ORIENTATION=+